MSLITHYLLICPVSALGTFVALVYTCNIKTGILNVRKSFDKSVVTLRVNH